MLAQWAYAGIEAVNIKQTKLQMQPEHKQKLLVEGVVRGDSLVTYRVKAFRCDDASGSARTAFGEDTDKDITVGGKGRKSYSLHLPVRLVNEQLIEEDDEVIVTSTKLNDDGNEVSTVQSSCVLVVKR